MLVRWKETKPAVSPFETLRKKNMFVSVRLTALLSEVNIHFIYNPLSVNYVVLEHELNKTHLKSYFLKYKYK